MDISNVNVTTRHRCLSKFRSKFRKSKLRRLMTLLGVGVAMASPLSAHAAWDYTSELFDSSRVDVLGSKIVATLDSEMGYNTSWLGAAVEFDYTRSIHTCKWMGYQPYNASKIVLTSTQSFTGAFGLVFQVTNTGGGSWTDSEKGVKSVSNDWRLTLQFTTKLNDDWAYHRWQQASCVFTLGNQTYRAVAYDDDWL